MLQIDYSSLALDFRVVVFPSEWRPPAEIKDTSSKKEKYRTYFQVLIDELREKHRFINAHTAPLGNYVNFPTGVRKAQGISYSISFSLRGIRSQIVIESSDQDKNKRLFDALQKRETEIAAAFGRPLKWNRLDELKRSTINIYRDGKGSIYSPDSELEAIRSWHIETLIRLKEVFGPEIERALKEIG